MSSTTSLEEKCLQTAQAYQKQFPSVIALSSKDFLHNFPHDNYQLLDCRTMAERNVSTIAGACPVHEVTDNVPVVVCYCTIGYRSGLEARQLQLTHPDWTVYNLDGIVAFSHASSASDRLYLVKSDGEQADRVHTFAGLWNFVPPSMGHVAFGWAELPGRFLQVGGRLIVRTVQLISHHCSQCCR